jgi:hypothetical protein
MSNRAAMEEAAEIQGLIAAVVDSNGSAARSCYDRYKAIVSAICSVVAAVDPLLDLACGKPASITALQHFMLKPSCCLH